MINFGWIRQIPDIRDFSPEDEHIRKFYQAVTLPTTVDMRPSFGPIIDQGAYGTCTANALDGVFNYLRLNNKKIVMNLSRAFNYFYGRKLIGEPTNQDTGTTIKAIVQSLVKYGTVPEIDYTYVRSHLLTKTAPSSTIIKKALNYQALTYVLLDQPKLSGTQKLTAFKTALANKLPIIVGFDVYDNYGSSNSNGIFLYPEKTNQCVGGHAIVIVGYDDTKVCGKYTGAFIIRNSWGTGWGIKGYGFIPYQYLISGLMADGWNILTEEMP
jgi:C1A family cysteine protease